MSEIKPCFIEDDASVERILGNRVNASAAHREWGSIDDLLATTNGRRGRRGWRGRPGGEELFCNPLHGFGHRSLI